MGRSGISWYCIFWLMMSSIVPCACGPFVYLWRCLYFSPSPIFKLDYLFVVELYAFIIALKMKKHNWQHVYCTIKCKKLQMGKHSSSVTPEVVTGADTCFVLVLHWAWMVLFHLHSCVTVALGGPGSQQHQGTQLGSGRARCGWRRKAVLCGVGEMERCHVTGRRGRVQSAVRAEWDLQSVQPVTRDRARWYDLDCFYFCFFTFSKMRVIIQNQSIMCRPLLEGPWQWEWLSWRGGLGCCALAAEDGESVSKQSGDSFNCPIKAG